MVVILQSNLFSLHVAFRFLRFSHLYFYCPAFKAPIGWPAHPVSRFMPGGGGPCTENNSNSTERAGALAASTARSAPWPLHAAPSGVTGLLRTSDKPCPPFSSLLCRTFCSLRNPTTQIIHSLTK